VEANDRRTQPRDFHSVLLALFFASGFVALLYQVIWQRLLALVTGLDLYAVTLIVAVFMLGMGLGSFAGGRLADQLPARRLLLLFAAAELVIALFALGSARLYHDVLYSQATALAVSPFVLGSVAASTLLLPTFCMGMTLPVLGKALSPSISVAASRIAGLYGWNTLGAAMGAWVGSAVLIRSFGYETSLWIGALVNMACASVTVLLLRASATSRHSLVETPAAHGTSTMRPGWPWPLWLAIYFLSGFIALGLEMVWFRLLGVVLKSTAFTFPLLLGTYLAGVGAGSLIGRAVAHRAQHPVRWFLLAQAGVPLYAGLSVGLLLWALPTVASLEKARVYLGSYEPIEFAFNFFELSTSQAALYVLVPAAMILPATILMGMSFSFIQQAVQSDLAGLGRRVGSLQTANILGSTVGVVLVGLVLIDRLGTASTLRLLTACSVVFLTLASASVLAKATRQARWIGYAVCTVVAFSSALLIPSSATFWGALHAVPEERIIHVDDGTGLAVLTSPDTTFRNRADVYVNGLGQSSVPFTDVHAFLGLAPVMLHPAPRRIAIIGLGSGGTAYAAAGRPETEALDCVEIVGGQIHTLRALFQRTGYPGLGGLLHDPRIRFVVGDGRRFIMQSREGFDLIEADALRPNSAYSGNLYSREYFELLRSRLTPGGMAVTWAPTSRIEHTFMNVFRHVVAIPPMLIGSNEPIVIDANAIRTRAEDPFTAAHYARAGIPLQAYVTQIQETAHHRETAAASPVDAMLNTDLFPRDELRVK
jgi:spermidine synthase